ncbi:MAG: glycine cleavage system protein GcvH [Lentisphaeria bacterium]|nr:glycine cleavage system protein GcvH [Lentisphaeria bacterium]
MEKYYSKTHEWVQTDGEEAVVGITEFATGELGDLTSIELPEEGTDVIAGDVIATVESVKASSEVFSPVSGTVCAVNRNVEDDPGITSRSPEKYGWLYKLDNIDDTELEDLMEEDEYQEYLTTLDS